MALPKIEDAGVVSEFVLFGWPWHGLAVGGEVTLVNAETRTITQPQSSNAFILRKPAAAEVGRTPAQVAAAEAQGMDWTNYQLQQGEKNNVIYGVATHADSKINWIGFDEAGIRWKVVLNTPTVPAAMSGTHNITFQISKFGEMRDGAAHSTATRVVALDLADLLLSELPGDFVGAFTNFNIRLDAISESGGMAVFSVVAPVGFSGVTTGETTSYIDYPVAVFSATLAGSPPLIEIAVVSAGSALFEKIFTYDDASLGAAGVLPGSFRCLGGTVRIDGSADVLIWRWVPDVDGYFDMPRTDSVTECDVGAGPSNCVEKYVQYLLETKPVQINLETLLAGDVLASLPVQWVFGGWAQGWWGAYPEPETCPDCWAVNQSFLGNSGGRVIAFGYDDKVGGAGTTDPYLIVEPALSDFTVTPFWDSVSYEPLPPQNPSRFYVYPTPALAVHESASVQYAASPLSIFSIDVFRVNANVFVVGHHDGSQWNLVQAVDQKGNLYALAEDVPKIDLPFCAVEPAKALFDYSLTVPRVFV